MHTHALFAYLSTPKLRAREENECNNHEVMIMPQVLHTNEYAAFAQSVVSGTANVIGKVFTSILTFFGNVAQAHSRSEQIERMNNLTDVELANKYNINRDQIIMYVFRDKMI
jgi:hypothetical protein